MPLLPSHPPGGHRNTEGSTPHYPPQPTPAAPHRIASHRIEVLLLHPQIGSDLLGAHLGIKDRQLGTFVQQVAADANGRCLTGFVDVGFVDAVGRRPYAKPSTA